MAEPFAVEFEVPLQTYPTIPDWKLDPTSKLEQQELGQWANDLAQRVILPQLEAHHFHYFRYWFGQSCLYIRTHYGFANVDNQDSITKAQQIRPQISFNRLGLTNEQCMHWIKVMVDQLGPMKTSWSLVDQAVAGLIVRCLYCVHSTYDHLTMMLMEPLFQVSNQALNEALFVWHDKVQLVPHDKWDTVQIRAWTYETGAVVVENVFEPVKNTCDENNDHMTTIKCLELDPTDINK